MPEKLVITEDVKPETAEFTLDELEQQAILGDPPPEAEGDAGRKIHALRLRLREGILNAAIAEKATRADLGSAFLAQQAERALEAARQALHEQVEQVQQAGMAQATQLRAARDRVLRDDDQLTRDGLETRRARRESILRELRDLDEHERHAALDDPDVAEAVALGPAWRVRGLELLPDVVNGAVDRLIATRAPETHRVWREGVVQLGELETEIKMARRMAAS